MTILSPGPRFPHAAVHPGHSPRQLPLPARQGQDEGRHQPDPGQRPQPAQVEVAGGGGRGGGWRRGAGRGQLWPGQQRHAHHHPGGQNCHSAFTTAFPLFHCYHNQWAVWLSQRSGFNKEKALVGAFSGHCEIFVNFRLQLYCRCPPSTTGSACPPSGSCRARCRPPAPRPAPPPRWAARGPGTSPPPPPAPTAPPHSASGPPSPGAAASGLYFLHFCGFIFYLKNLNLI